MSDLVYQSFAATLNALARHVHEIARFKGWHPSSETKVKFIPKTVANIQGEVSEFWEAYRRGELFKNCDKADAMLAVKLPPLTCGEEELADIIIRVLDTAVRLEIDIGRAVAIKSQFNATRPYRHGGKKA